MKTTCDCTIMLLYIVQSTQASAVRLTMMIQGILTVLAITSLCSAVGSTVRMMSSSLTVREGETVSVCVVATLSAGQSVQVGLTSSSDQSELIGWLLLISVSQITLCKHTDLPVPSNTLMLDSNSPIACWTITATDDNVYEDDTEMVTLTLMSMTEGVTLGDPSTTVVSVMDTDGKLEHPLCTFYCSC